MHHLRESAQAKPHCYRCTLSGKTPVLFQSADQKILETLSTPTFFSVWRSPFWFLHPHVVQLQECRIVYFIWHEIQPSISYCLLCSESQIPGAYLSSIKARGRVHSGLVTCQSQRWHTEKDNLWHTHLQEI